MRIASNTLPLAFCDTQVNAIAAITGMKAP